MTERQARDISTGHPNPQGTVPEQGGPPAPPTVTDSLGGPAPSLPPPLPETVDSPRFCGPGGLEILQPGHQVGNYRIKAVLGKGGLAVVYLAIQVNLEHEVALKISLNRGSEGRTMATLEHPNIVKVHDEDVDEPLSCRILAMELVRGASLDDLLPHLRNQAVPWTGQDLLRAIEEHAVAEGKFIPEALKEREELERSNHARAVCQIIRQLAEALSHAHHYGVVHRDIKPGNVLVDRYGRVKLADFNIALDPQRRAGARGEIFGGTLDYMAPEHLDAFNPDSGVRPEAVDARSDIYAVGLLFYEMLTGDLPFGSARTHATSPETLTRLAGERRSLDRQAIRRTISDECLALIVLRCLEPNPQDRYQSAAELGQALADCMERERLQAAMPPLGRVASFLSQNPFLGLALLAFLPHLIGSVFNIGYNTFRIVQGLPEAQQVLFGRLVIVYNAFMYSLCLAILLSRARPWVRLQLNRRKNRRTEVSEFASVRQLILSWPRLAAALSMLGWFPGAIFFPLALHWLGGGIEPIVFVRFVVSFALSGLIALTYSVLGVQFAVFRLLYPGLLVQTSGLMDTTRRELPASAGTWVSHLAGLIPLFAAVLMVILGPMDFSRPTFGPAADIASLTSPYRILLALLIVLGMLGFWISVVVQGYLNRTLLALRGQMAEQKVVPDGAMR